MADDCPIPVQFCAARFARLASDGTTPAGSTNAYVVTDKLIEATYTREYQEGTDLLVQNGCGGLALSVVAPPTLKSGKLTLSVAHRSPEFIELLTDCSLITVSGSSDGYADPAVGANPGDGVSVELFRKAMVNNQQSASKPWMWHAFGKVIFNLTEDTFANSAAPLQLEGIVYENSNWGNGPFNDWPTGAISTRLHQAVRAATLPTGACGYQTVPTQV